MKCPIDGCEGYFRHKSGWYVRGGIMKRLRICDTCGHVDRTIEVSVRDYDRMKKLVIGLKILLKEYLGGN